MDSTFLGVLVGLSMKLEKLGGPKPVVFRAGECTNELFKTLGVERFFELNDPHHPVVEPGELDELAGASCKAADWAPTIIGAHQLLCEVDDRNGPRFQDLLEYLKRDAVKSALRAPPDTEDSTPSRWKQ